MASQDHADSTVNATGTDGKIDTPLTHPSSRDVLRRDLIVMRGGLDADSAAGHHISNIVELFKLPNPPAALLKRQMDGLQRALRDVQ